MTAVKENLLALVPEIPDVLPALADDEVQMVINILFERKKPAAQKIIFGVGEGKFTAPDDFDEFEDEAIELLMESALS